ncbi:MAG: zinc-ribbon domain-containing protein [Thermodesulfobacteriota bacterium]|nr:zinc-ribbon domain-containing protein [Thermodesulfobacteriota bacterium]
MKREDMVFYLANILLISLIDGVLSPLEAKAVESICQEIGASENDFQNALNTIDQTDYRLKPVGRFSDRVRNLEDMVFVSLSDGELSKSEKPELLSFAKELKISQNQLTEILTESKLRMKIQQASIKCSFCNKAIPSESKFCPQCGANLQKQ